MQRHVNGQACHSLRQRPARGRVHRINLDRCFGSRDEQPLRQRLEPTSLGLGCARAIRVCLAVAHGWFLSLSISFSGCNLGDS
jgi:hypothetical protein